MKKTLIALAALAMASVANADITSGPTYGGNFWISDFDFTFQLTDTQVADMQQNSTVYTLAAYWGSDPSDGAGANIFTLSYTSDGITLTAGRGALNESASDTTTATWKAWSTLQNSTNVVVVYSGLQAGVTYTVDTTGANGNNGQNVSLLLGDTTLATGKTYNGNMNGNDSTPQSYFNTAFTPATTGENAPEPATATLSLLALAGLAARRRRK